MVPLRILHNDLKRAALDCFHAGSSATFYMILLLIQLLFNTPTNAIKCRSYGNTYRQGLEPADAVKTCQAQRFCGRMDAGNDDYHEVMYFCDGLSQPNLLCGGVGCEYVYKYPNKTATWNLRLHDGPGGVPRDKAETTYFKICCCDSDMCFPDEEAAKLICSAQCAVVSMVTVLCGLLIAHRWAL